MLAFVANQVGADPKLFGDYAHRAETRREHLLELLQYLRLRSFRLADWRACLNVGANAAWATDRGEPIVQAILAHLRAERVIVPAAAVLERIGLAARVRARRRVFQALAEGLSNAAREVLCCSCRRRQRSQKPVNGILANSLMCLWLDGRFASKFHPAR